MIEKLTGLPETVAAFACHGQVTRADYTSILVPEIERLLRDHAKLRIYYEVAPDFTGFEPGAMWEDAKLGLGHLTAWGRVALVTDVTWIGRTATFFAAIMPGQVRVFPIAETAAARAWIVAD
jgi:hypothetical protein